MQVAVGLLVHEQPRKVSQAEKEPDAGEIKISLAEQVVARNQAICKELAEGKTRRRQREKRRLVPGQECRRQHGNE